MSDYGPPAPATPEKADPSGGPAHLVQLTNYAAAGLGVLAFIWGFLNWYSSGGEGESGFAFGGQAAIGLVLVAGLLALAAVFEKSDVTLVPAVFAVAGLLVTFGSLVSKVDGTSVGIGLILILITALVQAAVLGYGWMLSTGRMAAPAPKPKAPQNQWQQGPSSGYGAPQGPPPGYGAPQGPPPGYGAPQGPPSGYGAPQGPTPGYGAPQGPPPGYGAPQGPPSGYQPAPPSAYGAPSGYGAPQPEPQGQPASDATQVFSRSTFTQSQPESAQPESDAPDDAPTESEPPRDWSRPNDGYGQ
jgi:hypothetical protein